MIPRLSISAVIAAHNGTRWLRELLYSISQNTVVPDEIIVWDDRSDDATPATVEAAGEDFELPVTLLRSPRRLGTVEAFAHGLARATGDVLLMSDQDDRWVPQRVEVSVRVLANTSACFSDAYLIGANGEGLRGSLWKRLGFRAAEFEQLSGGGLAPLLKRNVATGTTMALRREVLRDLLPVPTGARHDAWIALSCAALGQLTPIKEPLVEYRLHSSNLVGAPRRWSSRRLREGLGAAQNQPDLIEVTSALRRFGSRADPEACALLNAKGDFLMMRQGLGESRHPLTTVIAQALAGDYGRFSASATQSLARDGLTALRLLRPRLRGIT